MSGVRVSTLANGLRVATDPMPGLRSVAAGVYVDVGARFERRERNGVAQFLEHMVFKGTRRRSAKAIAEEIEAVGGQLNAWTGREQTGFTARVLDDDLPLAIDMIADMLRNSVFDVDELAREKQVILQEIGQVQDTPDDIVFDHLQAAAFADQPLGRPVLGEPDTVAAIDRDDVIAYLAAGYGANRMILSAAGAVDHDALVRLAEDAFGDAPAGDAPTAGPATYTGGELRDERDLEQTHIALAWAAPALADPRQHAVAALSTLLGGGMSSRLFYEIREVRGLAYAVHSFVSQYADAGLFGVYAGADDEAAAELVDCVGAVMNAARDGVDIEELNRAKAQLRAGLFMGRESAGGRCEALAHQLSVYGRPIAPEETLSDLDAVDVAAVKAELEALMATPPTIATVGASSALGDYDAVAARLAPR
ncbi:MAG: pitrilysin family protein [Pseudomonadota bacterium]